MQAAPKKPAGELASQSALDRRSPLIGPSVYRSAR